MREIESNEMFFAEARQERPTVMVFSAGWCPDCRYLDTFIDDVERAYEGKLSMFKVDRDNFPELCETLDIMGIPSFVAYRNGQIVGRFVNGKRKTRAEVEGFLDEVLSKQA